MSLGMKPPNSKRTKPPGERKKRESDKAPADAERTDPPAPTPSDDRPEEDRTGGNRTYAEKPVTNQDEQQKITNVDGNEPLAEEG